MSKEIAEVMLGRIGAYAQRHELEGVIIGVHGGEPLLIGREWMGWFLKEARRVSDSAGIPFTLAIQTNGTLLDTEWVELLAGNDVLLGVSCDGPQELHDRVRVDFAG